MNDWKNVVTFQDFEKCKDEGSHEIMNPTCMLNTVPVM